MMSPRMRGAALGAAFIMAAAGVRAPAQMAPSGIRVEVAGAEVVNLACSRRPFKMENTAAVTRAFPQMMGGMINPDPRSIVTGLLGAVLLVPLTVLAVPSDLLAGPFRKDCSFELRMGGALIEWAGNPAPGAKLDALGRNAVEREEEGFRGPEHYTSSASAVSDASGGFVIALSGRVARSKDFDVDWAVNGSPAGTMRLRKKGGRFALAELEAGFGSGVYEPRVFEITPKNK